MISLNDLRLSIARLSSGGEAITGTELKAVLDSGGGGGGGGIIAKEVVGADTNEVVINLTEPVQPFTPITIYANPVSVGLSAPINVIPNDSVGVGAVGLLNLNGGASTPTTDMTILAFVATAPAYGVFGQGTITLNDVQDIYHYHAHYFYSNFNASNTRQYYIDVAKDANGATEITSIVLRSTQTNNAIGAGSTFILTSP